MTNPNKMKLVVILDRSGSMSTIKSDMIGGFNDFLDEQKKLNCTTDLLVVQFDDKYEVVYNGPIMSFGGLTYQNYIPRGSTALLQSMERTIDSVGQELAALPESSRPGKVLFLTITDGLENSSPPEFTRERLRDKIVEQREKYKWEFSFIGSNQDSILEGGNLGINASACMNYASSGSGVTTMFNNMSKAVRAYSNSGTFSY